ncbi:hypothetical protein Y032_0005g2679 [Ancylostoma ceylanicum]|uniref:Peptidase M10 metallopeptidase domain-containing protein n=2 Tax=Ancylostoma ceylanicum TaxID=53326 RepID=A0A016VT64_9BILA|nr:hypothetical protein Y032_0005g2679 [Ancylostoma ceylanicum]
MGIQDDAEACAPKLFLLCSIHSLGSSCTSKPASTTIACSAEPASPRPTPRTLLDRMLPLTICILFVVSTVGPAACDSTSARDSLPDLTGFSQIHSEDASPTEGVERQRDNTRQIFLRRRKRYVVRKKRWRHNLLTWRLDRSNIKDEDEYVIRTTLHRAFQEWSSASGARFEEIADGPADIVVGFERGKHQDAFPFDGKGRQFLTGL